VYCVYFYLKPTILIHAIFLGLRKISITLGHCELIADIHNSAEVWVSYANIQSQIAR
jgi:hypothetical protein